MESLEHNCGNISPTICTNMSIFGKNTFLALISRMVSTSPISSQILILVTSQFPSLFQDWQKYINMITIYKVENLQTSNLQALLFGIA